MLFVLCAPFLYLIYKFVLNTYSKSVVNAIRCIWNLSELEFVIWNGKCKAQRLSILRWRERACERATETWKESAVDESKLIGICPWIIEAWSPDRWIHWSGGLCVSCPCCCWCWFVLLYCLVDYNSLTLVLLTNNVISLFAESPLRLQIF